MGEGFWEITYTGKKMHFISPSPEEICIEDIAHALSMICRFNGHMKEFYSVEEHSVRVAQLLPRNLMLAGLFHDAAEAYTMDIPRPIKRAYNLHHIEEPVTKAIFQKYGIDLPLPKEVIEADETLLATELRDLMAKNEYCHVVALPLPERICPYSHQLAENVFLHIAFLLGVR